MNTLKKTCTDCKSVLELKEFHKSNIHKYGVRDKCKKCVSKYMKEYGTERRKRLEKLRRRLDKNPYGLFFYNLRNPFTNFSL